MPGNIKRKLANRFNLGHLLTKQNRIGSDVHIGKNTLVKGCYLSGDISVGTYCKLYCAHLQGQIKIGNYTSLWGPNIDLHAAINSIIIGNFCSVARNVTFQEYNHDYTNFTTYFIKRNLLKTAAPKEEIVSKGSIEVGSDVWIGTNSVILSGSTISTGAVIAAGSVVTGHIPPYAIAAGAPAKVIKYRFAEDIRNDLLATGWWNWPEKEIIQNLKKLTGIVRR